MKLGDKIVNFTKKTGKIEIMQNQTLLSLEDVPK